MALISRLSFYPLYNSMAHSSRIWERLWVLLRLFCYANIWKGLGSSKNSPKIMFDVVNFPIWSWCRKLGLKLTDPCSLLSVRLAEPRARRWLSNSVAETSKWEWKACERGRWWKWPRWTMDGWIQNNVLTLVYVFCHIMAGHANSIWEWQ